jgi:hypothetical protein
MTVTTEQLQAINSNPDRKAEAAADQAWDKWHPVGNQDNFPSLPTSGEATPKIVGATAAQHVEAEYFNNREVAIQTPVVEEQPIQEAPKVLTKV